MQVSLTNQPKERQKLLEALRKFARKNQLPAKVLHAADLALEEHLTNVLNYGFADTGIHEIVIRLEIVKGDFQIEIEDDGKAFNPLNHPEPDVSLPLSERSIGGLGIHLIRTFMDELSYCRERERNVFRMRKHLKSLPAN